MRHYQAARSHGFVSSPVSLSDRIRLLGSLRGAAVRARKNQIQLYVASSCEYLELVDLDLEGLAKQEGHAARALVLGVDFWIAGKETLTDWLSKLDVDTPETGGHDLIANSDLAEATTHPPDPPPQRLPPAGLNLTPRLLPVPRPTRS